MLSGLQRSYVRRVDDGMRLFCGYYIIERCNWVSAEYAAAACGLRLYGI